MCSALFCNQHSCDASIAVSVTNSLVFGILNTHSYSETMPPSCFHVRKAFRLPALELITGNKYVEVDSEMRYDGERIGVDFVRLTPVLGNGIKNVGSEGD